MGGLEGPPNPPALGDAPAKPGRPSTTAPNPPTLGDAPAQPGRPSMFAYAMRDAIGLRYGADWRTLLFQAAFGHVLSLLTGHPTTAIITAHNIRHHRHNNSNLDWVRCSLVTFRRNWLNLLAFPFVSVATMRAEKESDLRQWRAHHRSL